MGRNEEYIKELFYDARSNINQTKTNKMTDKVPITPQDVEFALKNYKKKRGTRS